MPRVFTAFRKSFFHSVFTKRPGAKLSLVNSEQPLLLTMDARLAPPGRAHVLLVDAHQDLTTIGERIVIAGPLVLPGRTVTLSARTLVTRADSQGRPGSIDVSGAGATGQPGGTIHLVTESFSAPCALALSADGGAGRAGGAPGIGSTCGGAGGTVTVQWVLGSSTGVTGSAEGGNGGRGKPRASGRSPGRAGPAGTITLSQMSSPSQTAH